MSQEDKLAAVDLNEDYLAPSTSISLIDNSDNELQNRTP
jgi:hypothetical protein